MRGKRLWRPREIPWGRQKSCVKHAYLVATIIEASPDYQATEDTKSKRSQVKNHAHV